MAERKKFAGKRILINGHMTLFTLAVIESFLRSGAAEVATIATPQLSVHANTMGPIREAGIPFYENIPAEKRHNYFDFCLDCGAGLLGSVKPKYGMVELTQTNPKLYASIPFPVITVDNSCVKLLETLGTGESVVRLLAEITLGGIREVMNERSRGSDPTEARRRNIIGLLSSVDIHSLFSKKKYLILGYGKVGSAIAMSLKKSGCKPKNIYVADISPKILLESVKEEFIPLLIDPNSKHSIERLIALFPSVYAVITATGVENVISNYFEPQHFSSTPFLINMGTSDEFGCKFNKERILNNKLPANFSLEFPTEVKFLDGIFYLWCYGCHELLTKKLGNGLSPISEEIDISILNQWLQRHEKNTSSLLEFQNKAMDLIASAIHSPQFSFSMQ